MTRSEINKLSIECFLQNIDRLKETKDLTEYRIMMNCKLLQPEFKQRGLITQVRKGRKNFISTGLLLLIAKSNQFSFIID
jgi:hypothetical protein